MATGQRRIEQDTSARQGETGGTGDNCLQRLAEVHRGGQTKGEHLGVTGHVEAKGHQYMGQKGNQTKEQRKTGSNEEGARRAVDEGIDIDECIG